MMRLTVLGASPACQNPGGACSGYLVEQDDAAILIDCGSGVFSRLQTYVQPHTVKAVIISHMHADHILDLIQYRYYLYFSAINGAHRHRPALYLPPEGHDRLLGISRLQDTSPGFFSEIFDTREYDPAQALDLGPFNVDFVPVRHIPHTYGMRIRAEADLAFSADSGPCDGLPRVARDSDLFLCECSNTEQSDYPFHLTPRQAADAAREAGTRNLLLTHRWWVDGKESAVAEARERYDGPVSLAYEDLRVTIER
jgi:ribonuclease BN (tRNA processing enzyme)